MHKGESRPHYDNVDEELNDDFQKLDVEEKEEVVAKERLHPDKEKDKEHMMDFAEKLLKTSNLDKD